MASAPNNPVAAGPLARRLAGQVQALSELTESLAFRLLELEERLAAQEIRLQPVQPEDVTELRLDETEERLARLEGLLAGLEGTGDVRCGASLVPLARPEDPFYEEGEQPFMDEQLVDQFPEDEGDRLDRLSA